MPKLKRTYGSMDEVEESFRPFYAEQNGKAVLNVEIEGMAPASKVEEFRSQNVALKQQHEEELKKYEGVDVEEYRTLKSRAELLDEKKLIAKGEVDTVVAQRVESGLKEARREIEAGKGREHLLRDRLESVTIEAEVVKAAQPFGLRKGAATDLIARARRVFKANEQGEVIAYEPDGKTPKTHLGDPYTIEQFIKDTAAADDGKHLFEENSGGGADQFKGGGGDGYNGINPWDPTTLNRSKQSEMIIKNRPLAIKLAAKFGVTIQPLPTTR